MVPLVDDEVGVEPGALRRDWLRHRARITIDAIHTLIREIREIDPPRVHGKRPAPVFVHAGTDVEPGRNRIANRAVRSPAHEHIPAAFGRPALEPVDVVAVQRDGAQSQTLVRHQGCRYRGWPRAVGSDHEPVSGLRPLALDLSLFHSYMEVASAPLD